MTDKQVQVLESLTRHNGNKTEVAREMGVSRSTVRNQVKALTRMGEWPPGTAAVDSSGCVEGMDLEELKLRHDKATQVENRIDEELEKGFDKNKPYCYEAAFRERCGLGAATPAWAKASRLPKYNKYKFQIGSKVIWASPSAVKAALDRETGITAARAFVDTANR